MAILMLWKFSQSLKPKTEFWYLSLFSVFVALQIWSCIYLGWFLGFFLGVGSLILFAKKSTRPLLVNKIRAWLGFVLRTQGESGRRNARVGEAFLGTCGSELRKYSQGDGKGTISGARVFLTGMNGG